MMQAVHRRRKPIVDKWNAKVPRYNKIYGSLLETSNTKSFMHDEYSYRVYCLCMARGAQYEMRIGARASENWAPCASLLQ